MVSLIRRAVYVGTVKEAVSLDDAAVLSLSTNGRDGIEMAVTFAINVVAVG